MNLTNNKMIDLDLRGFNGTTDTVLELFKYVARRENWSEEEITSVVKEANKHNDYDHFIATIIEHCKY